MSGNANLIFLLFLNILAISALNQEGLSFYSQFFSFCHFLCFEERNPQEPMSMGLHQMAVTALEIFQASGNPGICGEIPMQISQCKLVVFLDLAETGISGKIPYNLGELKNLKTLTLQISLVSFHVKLQNKLAGNIPRSLGNCSSLTRINFSIHSLMGQIPSELSLLKSGDSSH
ncbi:hypothetical protein ACSBR1_001141 [Camellia fascicularis]